MVPQHGFMFSQDPAVLLVVEQKAAKREMPKLWLLATSIVLEATS